MAIFLTGATGYIGAHIAVNLLRQHGEPLNLLVRARSSRDGEERLWQSLQLHFRANESAASGEGGARGFGEFEDYLRTRIRIFRGDLTNERFGLDALDYDELVHSTESVIHCAASLNRKSEKACLNTNLRGTLEVVQLAQRARDHHGLRRISHVSTVAVAGERSNELVQEDTSVDWNRSDYDPYARTKKFCEHMIRRLLPEVPRTIFRPSIVLGDSRYAETTQFDMVRAFVLLAGLPLLPFRPTDKIDIVNVDFVADAVATLHQKDRPGFDLYHLSSGRDSQTFQQLTDALAAAQHKSGPMFMPALAGMFGGAVNGLASIPMRNPVAASATLLKVFWPYLTWNTQFDNSRVTTELGRKPVPFSQYSYPLLRFSRDNRFRYPYTPWPVMTDVADADRGSAA